jgi:hypothetical protein
MARNKDVTVSVKSQVDPSRVAHQLLTAVKSTVTADFLEAASALKLDRQLIETLVTVLSSSTDKMVTQVARQLAEVL